MSGGLTTRQRELVNEAAMGALVELLTEHPTVAKLPAGVITTVFLAGVTAGVDALDAVLRSALLPEQPGADPAGQPGLTQLRKEHG